MTQKEANNNTELDTSIFRERFIRLREEHQMSQAQFAVFLGIPSGSVGGYENGTKFPNGKTLFAIASKCGVSADYLLGLHSNPVLKEDIQMICEYTGLNIEAVNRLHNRIKFYPECDIVSYFIAPKSKSRYINDLINIAFSLSEYHDFYSWVVEDMQNIEKTIDNFSEQEIKEKLYFSENNLERAKLHYYDTVENFRLLVDEYNRNRVKTPENETVVMEGLELLRNRIAETEEVT